MVAFRPTGSHRMAGYGLQGGYAPDDLWAHMKLPVNWRA